MHIAQQCQKQQTYYRFSNSLHAQVICIPPKACYLLCTLCLIEEQVGRQLGTYTELLISFLSCLSISSQLSNAKLAHSFFSVNTYTSIYVVQILYLFVQPPPPPSLFLDYLMFFMFSNQLKLFCLSCYILCACPHELQIILNKPSLCTISMN